MKKSKFQVHKPELKKLNFQINEQFDRENFTGLDIDAKTVVNRRKNSARVKLEIEIFKENDINDVPFCITIAMEADFKWDESLSGKELDYLLNSNAPAVLLSYMRPYISSVTVGSGYPPLILPLMDFTDNKVTEEETLQ